MTAYTTPAPEPIGSGVGVVLPAAAGEFTELDARRMNRVRRFFAQHPRASDVLVCVLAAADLVTTLISSLGTMGAIRWIVAAVFGVLGVVALWFRRRSPVVVLGTLTVLAAGNIAATGRLSHFTMALGFGIYAVAAGRAPRMTWLTVGGALLLAFVALMVADSAAVGAFGEGFSEGWESVDGVDSGVAVSVVPDFYSDISALMFVGLISLAIGTSVASRRAHVRALVARHRELVDAGEQAATLAAAAEQTRIAREMHDVVAHGLTVMVALADGARTAMRRSPDDADHALELLSETGRTALTDMRRMLGVLRGSDAPLEPQPQDLDELVQSFRAAGMTVHLTTSGPPLPEDPTLALTVYRVVQESLTNALRHAGTHTQADVIIARTRHEVLIEVTDDGPTGTATDRPLMAPRGERIRARLAGDDGPALPTPPRTGRGLVGMRERAAVYRGSVTAGPHLGGWRVRVLLQIDPEEDR
ncbi:histidine kinase [Cellulomonas sp. NPDC089187]|uniref:sensor histidine kinase n=1 Tax=Cellulomonas sp. NPDC089187 TaxID=3154970 RepID=UPI0034142C17